MINLSTSAFYDRGTRQLGSLQAEAATLQQQIATGRRLEKSSDDPVAAARLRTLDREQRLANIDRRSSERVQTDLGLTDDALTEAANIIIRTRELASQAATGTISIEQRAIIGTQIASLRDSLLGIANGRSTAGHALFGGETRGDAFAVAGGTVAYVGTATASQVDLGDGQTVPARLTGLEAFVFDAGGTTTDIFTVLGSLAIALKEDVNPTSASRTAMAELDGALDKMTTAQTIVGARMAWVETLDQRREATGERIASEQNSVGGTDLATAITRLQGISTVLEASQASFVRLANLTLFDVLR